MFFYGSRKFINLIINVLREFIINKYHAFSGCLTFWPAAFSGQKEGVQKCVVRLYQSI